MCESENERGHVLMCSSTYVVRGECTPPPDIDPPDIGMLKPRNKFVIFKLTGNWKLAQLGTKTPSKLEQLGKRHVSENATD